ncbi:MAG TPA: DNA/RNA nuclease SfsA [Candidatus Marinimicrobia bacterium]|nr:DNA/RNA nuclease SfsA [Candidatus Neomarinimicrobiota bacterium]
MILPDLLPAVFIERPNRFLVRCNVDNKIIDAHLPDPGRLKELLLPGAEIFIEHTPNPSRKTQYTVHLIKNRNVFVSINTSLPNKLVYISLKNNCLPGFEMYTLTRSEVPVNRHRFDFELRSPEGKKVLMEVKSVTLVEDDGTARFPDAVTSRGKSHAETLAILDKKGIETWILFIVQRKDAICFTPHWERDPAFAKALLTASVSGVNIKVVSCEITQKSMIIGNTLPFYLEDYRDD